MRVCAFFLFIALPAQAQIFESWAYEAGTGPPWFVEYEAGKPAYPAAGANGTSVLGRACPFLHVSMVSVMEGRDAVLYLDKSKLMNTFRVYLPENYTMLIRRGSYMESYIHEATHARQSMRGYVRLQAEVAATAKKSGFLWEDQGSRVKIRMSPSHADNRKHAEAFGALLLTSQAKLKALAEVEACTSIAKGISTTAQKDLWSEVCGYPPSVSSPCEMEAYWEGWSSCYPMIDQAAGDARYWKDKFPFGKGNLDHMSEVRGYAKKPNMWDYNKKPGRWEMRITSAKSFGVSPKRPTVREKAPKPKPVHKPEIW